MVSLAWKANGDGNGFPAIAAKTKSSKGGGFGIVGGELLQLSSYCHYESREEGNNDPHTQTARF